MTQVSPMTSRALARDAWIEHARVEVARLYESESALARETGCKRVQDVSEWFCTETNEKQKSPRFSDVRMWRRPFAKSMLTWAAKHHGFAIVDDADTPASLDDFLAHLPKLVDAANGVVSSYISAALDRIVDPAERRELLPRVRDLIGVLRAIETRLEADEAAERALVRKASR